MNNNKAPSALPGGLDKMKLLKCFILDFFVDKRYSVCIQQIEK